MIKPFASAADRNKDFILEALQSELSSHDRVFEFGSGTGQHLCHFAAQMPNVSWQPSDMDARLEGIGQWQNQSGSPNLLDAVEFDLRHAEPEVIEASVCYSANTLHIISWILVERLYQCASVILGAGGKLCIYGPFRFNGQHISDSNHQFDVQLRASDPDSGIRDIVDLDELATQTGFDSARIIPMPANNHLLVWRRSDSVAKTSYD